MVIVIAVEPPHRYRLLRSLKLSLHIPVIGTGVRHHPKPTVFPEQPLVAESMGCLDNGHQHGRADRTQGWNRPEQFPRLVLLALGQEFPPGPGKIHRFGIAPNEERGSASSPMKGQKPERGCSQGRGARHERSAAKRASILDGSPSGGYR